MTRRATLESYAQRGWALVPILAGEKAPGDLDWQKRTYALSDIPDNANVGIHTGAPSGGLIDIDCDCKEAVAAARELMPETGLMHGRPSNPSSHLWYRVRDGAKDLVATRKFLDLNGSKMLVELRSTGSQTLIPPSIHDKTHEPYAWEKQGEPLAVTGDDLLQATRILAITALFARNWPAEGRHFAAGHLAGFLLRCGLEPGFVVRMVETAARIAGDEEVPDRRRIAEDTARKHTSGHPTTGRPKIIEAFPNGEALVARVYQWLERKGEDLLDEINESYFTARTGTTTVVAHIVKGEELEVFKFEEMKNRFCNRRVGKQTLGTWWLTHPQRRSYRRIVCAPPPLKAHPEDYNTWQGFSVEPDPNPDPYTRCARFLHHMRKVICNGEDEYYSYLLDVCAITVQRPGVPSEVAVVLRGPSGVGKGSFISNFGKLFGPHFLPVSKPGQVTGRFNAHLSGCVVLFADEAVWGGNKQDVGTLRALVTEHLTAIEKKGLDIVRQLNMVHMFMATNEDWVWPVAMRERRGFILDVAEQDFMTPKYFTDLHTEWENGGAAAFLAVCQQRELFGGRLGPVPKTPGLIAQMDLSNNPLHQWWTDRLSSGEFWPGQGWPEFASTADLLANFYELSERGYGRATWSKKQTEMTFSADLKTLLPPSATRRKRFTNVNVARPGMAPELQNMQRWGWVMPRLLPCRNYYDRITGVPREWPEPEGDAADHVTPVLTGLGGDE